MDVFILASVVIGVVYVLCDVLIVRTKRYYCECGFSTCDPDAALRHIQSKHYMQ